MEETTDSIRALAPRWSLAGDEKLLKLLQITHQKIISNCREVNTRLDEMATALGSTTINLQNVNNKFMALSNSQFIESRVFDDDADVTAETKPVEEHAEPESIDSLALLKQSLVILDNAHETAEIWDDSDIDSDNEISVILKPKDAYAHRPLPYIIGSRAWKNKWHAGLVIEESDTDSDVSKHDVIELEQFSESDEEVQTDKLVPSTISDSGSSFHSERDKELAAAPERKPTQTQTPADVAAELAARLGNAPPRMLEEPEESIPQTTPKTVYRPQKPVSSTIFSDEPPPIERDTYEHYSSESQEDDDIFAEINKKLPYCHSNTAQNKMADDLFGRKVFNEDVIDFKNKVEPKGAKQKSTLFEDESEPELFVEKPKTSKDSTKSVRNEDNTTKKPIGGISLFGSNKGTESIGEAILKRSKRKSSSSDNESDNLNNKNTIKSDPASDSEEDTANDNTNNANYIFDNLFAKAKQAEEKSMKQTIVDRPAVKEKPEAAKTKEVKDLFSDNIFDDIDDIFTSNIKIPTKEANKNVKSIFDDDDDLFSDIAKKPEKITKPTKPNSSKKSIFDSDDDLFGDLKDTKNDKMIHKDKPEKAMDKESQITHNRKETNYNTAKPDIVKDTTISVDITKNIESKESKMKPKAKSKSIFDSDSDEDLFSSKIKAKTQDQVLETSKSVKSEIETELFKEKKETRHVTLKTESAKDIHSPSLFEEDEIDDLFINANKAKDANLASKNTIIEQINTKDISGLENKHKDTDDVEENTLNEEEKSKLHEDNNPRVVEDKNSPNKKSIFPTIETPECKPDKIKYNLLTNVETVNTKLNIPENIADDDIIETSQEPLNVQSKISSNYVAVESNLQEPVSQIDNNQTINVDTENDSLLPESQEPFTEKRISKKEDPQDSKVASIFDEVPVMEKQDIIPEQNSLVPLASAFDDIFKEPPAFEKTKEIKKTVNVNALFEDDSDDETLFFKKNDVISDEKPEIFSPSANFGLFNDEPPDFLDFAPKETRNNQFEGDDDNLFSSISKKGDKTPSVIRNEPPDIDECNDALQDQSITQSEKTTQKLLPNEENHLLSSTDTPKLDTPVKIKVNERMEVPDSDEELLSNIPKAEVPESSQIGKTLKSEKETSDQLDKVPKDIKTETDKKIGKLNTKDFNINVQALVPGASPKKISKDPSNETNINQVNTIETEETKEEVSITEVDNAEPKPVKSTSFESKLESGVLDNKLSKQRPRIQVKRRPSSRRARHEAVRKSVIDVEDDTDNSSSFDEPLPKIYQDTKSKENESNTRKNQDGATKTAITDTISNKNREQDIVKPSDKNDINIDAQKDLDNDKMFKTDQNKIDTIRNVIEKDEITNLDEVDSKAISKKETNFSKLVTEKNDESRSTTKVVYILNDEDIFSNNDKSTKTSTVKQANEAKQQESSKTVQPKREAKSMFDLSDDDEDLFGKSTKTKKVEIKSKLFESDSDEDIFSTKKNKEVKKHENEVKKNVKEEKVKGPLFGDDDDDLFGVKTKTSIQSTKASSSRPKETAKSTNIVFDDPLSMLDDD